MRGEGDGWASVTRGWQMGTSLVLELQDLASVGSSEVTDVLRKALMVATKLNLEDARAWLCRELKGYELDEQVPDYRRVYSTVRVIGASQRLEKLYLQPEIAKELERAQVRDAIANLHDLIAHGNASDEKGVQFPFTIPRRVELMKVLGLRSEPIRIVNVTQIVGIIEAVRTRILEWALQLEVEGILGEGKTFTREEREKATSSSMVHIVSTGNVQNVVGEVSGSTVTQNATLEVREGDRDGLRAFLEASGFGSGDVSELEKALVEEPQLESGKFGPKVSAWIGEMTRKAADGTVAIGLAAAGDILARALWAYYGST